MILQIVQFADAKIGSELTVVPFPDDQFRKMYKKLGQNFLHSGQAANRVGVGVNRIFEKQFHPRQLAATQFDLLRKLERGEASAFFCQHGQAHVQRFGERDFIRFNFWVKFYHVCRLMFFRKKGSFR